MPEGRPQGAPLPNVNRHRPGNRTPEGRPQGAPVPIVNRYRAGNGTPEGRPQGARQPIVNRYRAGNGMPEGRPQGAPLPNVNRNQAGNGTPEGRPYNALLFSAVFFGVGLESISVAGLGLIRCIRQGLDPPTHANHAIVQYNCSELTPDPAAGLLRRQASPMRFQCHGALHTPATECQPIGPLSHRPLRPDERQDRPDGGSPPAVGRLNAKTARPAVIRQPISGSPLPPPYFSKRPTRTIHRPLIAAFRRFQNAIAVRTLGPSPLCTTRLFFSHSQAMAGTTEKPSA